MYNLRNIHQSKAIRRYIKERMKESLITGVPEIASSENGFRRTVKSLVFMLCTAGFFYQAYVFTESFLKYDTIYNMRIDYPSKFPAPAVTFCSTNRISRPRYCTGLPEECLWSNKSASKFCRENKKICNEDFFNRRDAVRGIPINISHTFKSSNEFLDVYGPQSTWDFFKKPIYKFRDPNCGLEINGGFEKCKENDTLLIQVPSNGLPYKCLTVYSLIGKPNEEQRKLRLNDGYIFWLWLHPEQYVDLNQWFPYYMAVHDPRRLVNPLTEGIILYGHHRHMISFTMTQRQALPPPYVSNCEDYVTKWKENGGGGPMTKKICVDFLYDCLELCKIEIMMEKHSCVSKSITYPHRFPICSEDRSISDKVVKECLSGCREACDAVDYKTAVSSWSAITPADSAGAQLIKVVLRFGQLNIRRTFMEPKFQNIELFSYIGGFIGLWLGISLVTFIDFLETVTDIANFALMKWKKFPGKRNNRHIFPH